MKGFVFELKYGSTGLDLTVLVGGGIRPVLTEVCVNADAVFMLKLLKESRRKKPH